MSKNEYLRLMQNQDLFGGMLNNKVSYHNPNELFYYNFLNVNNRLYDIPQKFDKYNFLMKQIDDYNYYLQVKGDKADYEKTDNDAFVFSDKKLIFNFKPKGFKVDGIFTLPQTNEEINKYYNFMERNNIKYQKNIFGKKLNGKVCQFINNDGKWYITEILGDNYEQMFSY